MTNKLIKKTVRLTDRNVEVLHNEADKIGIKISELLRRIIDEKFDKKIES